MAVKQRLARSRHHHRAITPNEAVLAEWSKIGKDHRRSMCNTPKIDEEIERKAKCLMINKP